jgi:hypothetical protein
MKCGVLVSISFVLLQMPATAQMLPSGRDAQTPELTGNARVDLFRSTVLGNRPGVDSARTDVAGESKKSPWLAGGMSLVLPGSGEFYAGSYWKSALFLAIEVGAWVMAHSYDKKGDRQTDYFQNYADQHWSVVQYAQYSLRNFIPPDRQGIYDNLVDQNAALPPWQRVNWALLNRMESEIGGFYSHSLPPYGDQQYYELIGKYPQFVSGWDALKDNPLPPDYDQIRANLPQQFLTYASDRGKANDYYSTATTYVTVALLNHVVSGIDAAWTAISNNRAHAEASMQAIPGPGGMVLVPAVKIEYHF